MTATDQGLLTFVNSLGSEGFRHALRDYVGTKRWAMDSRALSDFMPLDEVKARFESMQSTNTKFYQEN